jgi:hypothetical protein
MKTVHIQSHATKIWFRFLMLFAFLLSTGPFFSAPVHWGKSLPSESYEGGAVLSEIPVTPGGINSQDWSSVLEQMSTAEYQVTWQARDGEWAYRAPNRAQELDLAFAPEGFSAKRRVANGEVLWDFGLSLRAYGDQVLLTAIDRLDLKGDLHRVEYHWTDSLVEWYENSQEGVEHGLTLYKPPENGGLVLTFALLGSLKPELDEAGQAIRFRDREGELAMHYDELAVVDSTGRTLPASMALSCERPRGSCEMEISVAAGSAIYPVTVDPRFHTETDILHAEDISAEDQFGYSVAVSGDFAVIGAPYTDNGSAYVFSRQVGEGNTWVQRKKLVAGDAEAGDRFGYSVAISGEVIVVGAPYEDAGGLDAGAAYVFHRNQGGADQWGQVAKLASTDLQAQDHFGISVAVEDFYIVVGAYYEDGGAGDPLPDAGAAYIFYRNFITMDSWGMAKKLTASDPQAVDFFSRSVAIGEEIIVVGAEQEDGGVGDPCNACGAAYVYQRNQGGSSNWGFLLKLAASTPGAGGYFGHSVATDGEIIVVGAPGGTSGGSAEVFSQNQGGADI